jgi:hypothetical protein
MLLETLDIKKNDIVIYSQNLFNHDKNFRIVFKDDIKKEPRNISYDEVCRYVNEYTPKNLIIYRLLTNIKNFEIYGQKYGFFLYINGITEMIFFDPIYAVRELEEYSQALDYNQLRFRIQQVGLTTLNRKDDIANFAEIYSIDMEATEAKFQNDKVFAQAIFSTIKISKPKNAAGDISDKPPVKKTVKTIEKEIETRKPDSGIIEIIPMEELSAVKEPDKIVPVPEQSIKIVPLEPTKQEKINSEKKHSVIKIEQEFVPLKRDTSPIKDKKINDVKEAIPEIKLSRNLPVDKKHVEGIKIVSHDISEDKDFDYKEIIKINTKVGVGLDIKKISNENTMVKPKDLAEIKPENILQRPVKTEHKAQSLFGKFLKESKSNKDDKKTVRLPGDEKVSQVLDMFKSSASLNEYVKDRENKPVVLKLDNKKL